MAPEYSGWYEMFPLAPVYKSVTVHPGDSIMASVYFNSGTNKYTLSLADTTNGQSFTVNKSCPAHASCSRSSAEAISEAPSNGSSILPLTDFGAESYSSIRVTDRAGQRGGLRGQLGHVRDHHREPQRRGARPADPDLPGERVRHVLDGQPVTSPALPPTRYRWWARGQ